MNTDDLIAALAADARPVQTVAQRMARLLPFAFAISVGAFLVFWGLRPDLVGALTSAPVIKTALPLMLAVLAYALALGQSYPDLRPTGRLAALWAFGLLLLAGLGASLFGSGISGLVAALSTSSLVVCLLSIPTLALPLLAAILLALSNGASLHPSRTGAVAGLAAGGGAAALYSLFCDQDAALYYLPAYTAAILLVSLAGAIIGTRLLRW